MADNAHITSPSQPHLASLVRQYWAECDANSDLDENGDVNSDAQAAMCQMIGVPVRTADDARAAFDWLVAEGVDLGKEYDPTHLTNGGPLSAAATSLVHALRNYLAPAAA